MHALNVGLVPGPADEFAPALAVGGIELQQPGAATNCAGQLVPVDVPARIMATAGPAGSAQIHSGGLITVP